MKHWPAVSRWSIPYLRRILGDEVISVAVTPNGYADAIAKADNAAEEFFVMPEERDLTMFEFLDELENPRNDSIFYIQKQNSNFISSFRKLWLDAEVEIPWANETFGKQPDAVNFWMGDERAVTSSKVLFRPDNTLRLFLNFLRISHCVKKTMRTNIVSFHACTI